MTEALRTALHKEYVWHAARNVCDALGIQPSPDLGYLSRRFVLEVLSDINTTAGRPGTPLGRWLINGRRWKTILEIGAWHGVDSKTTCENEKEDF